MGQVLLTGEEPQERSALLRDVVADSPPQPWIAGFERVEDRALRHRSLDLQLHLAVHTRQRPQMCREHDSNHFSLVVREASFVARNSCGAPIASWSNGSRCSVSCPSTRLRVVSLSNRAKDAT